MSSPTLYRIIDEYPWLEREDKYSGLTLTEAAIRMDDLTGCGEDVILSDWDERCERCKGHGKLSTRGGLQWKICDACGGTGKWPGPWHWEDDETGREVTMMRRSADGCHGDA